MIREFDTSANIAHRNVSVTREIHSGLMYGYECWVGRELTKIWHIIPDQYTGPIVKPCMRKVSSSFLFSSSFCYALNFPSSNPGLRSRLLRYLSQKRAVPFVFPVAINTTLSAKQLPHTNVPPLKISPRLRNICRETRCAVPRKIIKRPSLRDV